ncbi:gamma-L-glutamyl-butirosin B gamma-glutamyl cyclotransferase [Oxobacter pfennigii]|uniref:Gamma-L-glutamyl-butirosin B gamma-glutamyl cyclotransferase n=1 Tax=Oxobacter pfennigii TaxID=36849 RepID=A0A0P8WVY2_9CLOT|nr:gamma-glutamylcyclotransferase family protein [Oxobacter pfennigii]KPU42409.1 gamma-L-glutamyl-butirosin B gamma-glutamyl cyclotransferase [Oxobacter pfennigii]
MIFHAENICLWDVDGGFLKHNFFEDSIASIRKAKTRGDLYHLPEGYPALIKGTGEVFGELIEFSSKEILKSIDCLEDYFGPGLNNLYERVETVAELIGGEKTGCFIYIYCNEDYAIKNGILVPKGDWREHMKNRG